VSPRGAAVRRRRCVASVLAILLVLAGAGSSPAEDRAAKRLLRSGLDRYRAFDYEGAAEDLRNSLAASSPDDEKAAALVLRALGDVFVVLGRDVDAEGAYRRLLDLERKRHPPADPALNATRWALYAVETALGRHEEAGRLFREVVDESPRAIVTTLVLVDTADINKVTLLSGFPVKYSEALARRALRVHERVYGADRAAAPAARLIVVLRELHRDDEASQLEARLRAPGPRAPAGH
jgi:tetratricopeptide (TPR) repeat protein